MVCLPRLRQKPNNRPLCETRADKKTVCDILAPFWPSHLQLLLTRGCNLACEYCYLSEHTVSSRMDLRTAKAAIDLLLSQKHETSKIDFLGGEPLIVFDTIVKCVDYAERQAQKTGTQLMVSMTTNGTMLDMDILRWCQAHRVGLFLSIDGSKETHDRHRPMAGGQSSHDLVTKWLPTIKKLRINYKLRATLMPETIHKLTENVLYLWDIGDRRVVVSPATGADWTTESLQVYEEQMKLLASFWPAWARQRGSDLWIMSHHVIPATRRKEQVWGCVCGRSNLAVTPEGHLVGCAPLAFGPEMDASFVIGTLADGVSNAKLLGQLLDRTCDMRPACLECDHRVFCGGGCLAWHYLDAGKLFGPSTAQCAFVAATRRVVGPWLSNSGRRARA